MARRLIGPAAIVAAGLAFLVSGPADAKKKAPTVTVGSNFYAPSFKTVKAGGRSSSGGRAAASRFTT
jgi:hypothetical protein